MIRALSLTALAVVLAGPLSHAQQGTGSQSRPQSQPQSTIDRNRAHATNGNGALDDALFVEVAAACGKAEVALSEIGARRASDPELKKFSQQMIEEHAQLNQELMSLASQKRTPFPRALDAKARFCAQSLESASEADFDHCYAKAQLIEHMGAVGTFEAEAERGQDPQIKAFAAKALPRIKKHLEMIKPIAMKYEKQHHSDAHDRDRQDESGKPDSDRRDRQAGSTKPDR